MTRSKHSRPDEYQKEIIRNLRKELKRKDQEIRRLQKELGYQQNNSTKSERRSLKEFEENKCKSCGKGHLKEIDLGLRKYTVCSLCGERTKTK